MVTVESVLVIGAGPAGLAAARAARRAGATVTLLEASDELGGQYWRHLPSSRPSERESVLHHGWKTFTELRRALRADAGCRILTSTSVWSIEPGIAGGAPRVLAVQGEVDGVDREQLVFEPDTLVIATGAYDRTLPFPGWDLPGVFTAGAAQALAKGERVAIGERVIVAGAGPFLLPVAASLASTGSTVVGIFEASRVSTLAAGWLPKPWQLLRSAHKAGELGAYLFGQLKHRIPYTLGTAVIEAHGTDRVEAVTVASVDADWRPIAGTERRFEVDAVCIGHGFTPRLELAIAAGARQRADLFIEVDVDQRAAPDVFVAGELTGIGGVDAALAEGEIAGHCAAGGASSERSLTPALKRRAASASFAGRIEAGHGIANGWADWLTPETLVCRCEEVSFGTLCDTLDATEDASLRSVKLATRAGLGICQGRVCGRTVEQLLGARAPLERTTLDASTDQRPIALPIRLGELAAEPHPQPN